MGNSNSNSVPETPLVLSRTEKQEILNWITQDNILHNELQPSTRIFIDPYGKSNDCYYTSGRFITEDVARRIVRKIKQDWGCSYASIGLSIGVSSMSSFSEWRNYPGRCFATGISTIGWLRDVEQSVEGEQISRSLASAPSCT
jgi:hypothetical protein